MVEAASGRWRTRTPGLGLEIDIALDVLVFSDENAPLIAVEAKKPASQLDKTLASMESRSGEPFPFECKPAGKLTNADRKFRALLILRPTFFAGVAPAVTRVYEVDYHPEVSAANLVPVDRLPDYAATTWKAHD